MRPNEQGITEEIFQQITDYIEDVKELLSSDLWENIFLDCSKNEILIFWLLYRKSEVNMTEIAEYIHVPLNTATGIVGRMEKKGLVIRTRSEEDKRVVLIGISEKGMAQFQKLLDEMIYYGAKVMASLTKEEIALFMKMTVKVKAILKQEHQREEMPKKVRKIEIE
ncbi:MAG: MarR family transcriptional regulator [Lachnospiraceae bacterium]|nr:MarR family transcriptional regulator [Lachnospiraceae bacterium]